MHRSRLQVGAVVFLGSTGFFFLFLFFSVANKECKMNYPSTAFPSWKGRGESVEEKKANNSITHSLPVTNIPPPPPPRQALLIVSKFSAATFREPEPRQSRILHLHICGESGKGKGAGKECAAPYSKKGKRRREADVQYSKAKHILWRHYSEKLHIWGTHQIKPFHPIPLLLAPSPSDIDPGFYRQSGGESRQQYGTVAGKRHIATLAGCACCN